MIDSLLLALDGLAFLLLLFYICRDDSRLVGRITGLFRFKVAAEPEATLAGGRAARLARSNRRA